MQNLICRFCAVLIALAGAVLAGCASTSIQSAWFDPSYTGGPMKRIDVVGVGTTVADRRVFEDIFAQKLNAAGVAGVPGYTVMPEDARTAEAPFSTAIVNSGAQGLLVVRLLGVDTKTQVFTTMAPTGVGWGGAWGGPWGGPWGGGLYGPSMVPVTEVAQYDVASVEASLYDVKTRRLVWAATTQTFNPGTVAAETPGFADIIIKQLVARGLIVGGK